MNINLVALLFLVLTGLQRGQAQSTTGARSGGSSASTGAGYTSPGSRPPASDPTSMTIADEGASRSYMYVPPTPSPNRSASPDGSADTTGRQAVSKPSTPPRNTKKTGSRAH